MCLNMQWALSLYWLLSGYRVLSAMNTEAQNVSALVFPHLKQRRTPLLHLHVSTLKPRRYTEESEPKGKLHIVED